MTVKTMEDREFLRSLFLATGDADVLEMLEGNRTSRIGSTIAGLRARALGALPLVIGVAALFLYR